MNIKETENLSKIRCPEHQGLKIKKALTTNTQKKIKESSQSQEL